jgi:hypothetical protein
MIVNHIYYIFVIKSGRIFGEQNMNKENGKKYMILMVVTLLLVINIMPVVTSTVFSKSDQITDISTDNIEIAVQKNEDRLTLQYEINHYTMNELIIENKQFYQINIDDESNFIISGKPDLPNICRSIIIPDTAKMEVRVLSSNYEEIQGLKIAPSKGIIKRSINPDDVAYEFDEIYQKNAFFPETIVELQDPYILHDYRGQVVQINPFQYNPLEETLRCYTGITVEIYPSGSDTVNILTRAQPLDSIDVDFKQIYNRHFINFGILEYPPIVEQGNMLIIVYDDFWDSMLPFVNWKNTKGIPTEMVKVSEIGNANAIKLYIEQYYADNGLTFVLLVGDADEVPTLYTSPYTYGASDPSYSYIVGDDNYQDLFIGRFSAESTGDVDTQVERSIEYERDPQIGGEWYYKGTGVASNQGPGDDGEYDDEHMDFIRDDLFAYTYTEVDQIYDPYATSTMVSNALNDGRSIVNYCGHGSITSWGSSGFHTSDINALTNDNMLPFICCVACNNGEFDGPTCFAETWLRATNNGNNEPTGAIGVFASTQSQSWDPPMDAEDEIVDILIETYADNIRCSYGALCFEGTMHMMDEYGTPCYDETDAWTVFGDPSLQVRTDTPTTYTVNHDPSVSQGLTTFEVEVEGVKNALCAISQDFILLGYGYTNETGNAAVEFFEPFDREGVVDLVVTAYNMIPYMTILNTNTAPEKPERPDGPDQGKPGSVYMFTTVTTDVDGDQIFYNFSWGDDTYSGWVGPFESGETGTASHSWDENGTYEIRAKAKDVFGDESDWSEPFSVSMPRDRTFFFTLLEILEQFFPQLFSFLRGLN